MRFIKPLLIAAPLLFCTAYLNSATSCECGTHSGGITAYTVSGTGCCSGSVIGSGVVHTYIENEGVWAVEDSSIVNASTAQSNCCNQAPPVAGPVGPGAP